MGVQSNFMDALVPAQHRTTDDSRLEAAGAYRVILGHLREIRDPDAGVLQAAYAIRNWPRRLRAELRRLTGVTVRLGAAEVGLPDSDEALAKLEERIAERLDDVLGRKGPEGIQRLQASAQRCFNRAYSAYLRERGRGPSLVKAFR